MWIAEIFRSIQGEGRNQGRPCTFIRLSGCNLRCAWCDTAGALSGGESRSIQEVLEQTGSLGGRYICITGGEPLIQSDDLLLLLGQLMMHGYEIDIETNGTLDFRPVQPFASICMDVKCPSSHEQSDLSLLSAIRQKDSVKFVVADEDDCRYAMEILSGNQIQGEVFISPVFGSDYRRIAEIVIDNDLPVRLQVQLHRLIGVC
jgi:7-carboxy-7-deazaguanine synthase